MAKGADVLVHDVIVTSWVDKLFPAPRSETEEALRHHLPGAHTPVEEVSKVAEQAGVSTLVLNHFAPGNASAQDLLAAQQGFSGRLVIGEDLLELGVVSARREGRGASSPG